MRETATSFLFLKRRLTFCPLSAFIRRIGRQEIILPWAAVSGKALDRFLSERKDTRKVFLCLDSDTAGSEACTRLAQDIPGEIAVIRLVPARKDWNDVLRQQGDIPSRKFIAETITLRELPTAQPVPMLRMADVELTSVDWLMVSVYPLWKADDHTGQSRRGQDLLCHASCGGLHQPKALARYGNP